MKNRNHPKWNSLNLTEIIENRNAHSKIKIKNYY